jgi:two-component system, sensor histidine kinase
MSSTHHKLLARQIKKFLSEDILKEENISKFVDAINDSYYAYERDKSLSDHAFRISENEYIELNERLRSEIDTKKLSVAKLIDAVNSIDEEGNFMASEDLMSISNFLSVQIEKRKEAENVVKESENLMRMALEKIGDNVWEIDFVTDRLTFLKSSNAFLGYTFEELSGGTNVGWKNLHSEDTEIIQNVLRSYKKGLIDHHNIEYRLYDREGKLHWILDRGGLLESQENGSAKRIIGTLSDITDRKKSEESLARTAQLLSRLIGNLQSGILVESEARTVVLTNQLFCSMFGIPDSAESMVGMDCKAAAVSLKFIFKDGDKFLERIEDILDKKKLISGELLELNDGRIMERDYVPLFLEGKYSGHLWHYTDVTERKRAEQALIFREEKYRSIIANMNLGMIEVDLSEKILFANNSFCEMSGFSLNELLYKRPTDMFLMGQNAEVLQQKNELRRQGASDAYEVVVRNKRGEARWWLVSGAPLYNDIGTLIGSIGIHLDITPQKELELSLEKARKEALYSAEAKETFLANMSHELRTPLNGIMGMVRELMRKSINETESKQLESVFFAADHLLNILNDILDLSRIDAGKLQIEKIGFKFSETILRAVDVINSKAEEKGIKILQELPEEANEILLGDPHRIKQILINIIGNSIKFTESGYIKIQMSMEKFSGDQRWVRIRIKDTGIGMDPGFMKNLFKKFVQEDSSIVRKFGGTGLGLSITKELIELMGGAIAVQSEKGVGTEMTLTFPFKTGNESDLPETVDHSVLPTGIIQGYKVLLVEDNELNQQVASMTLSHFGLQVEIANNGREAVDILSEKTFDIVLMDVQMPILDGYEAARIIRNELQLEVPIIALTANALKGESDKCLSAGMNDFITKPFDEGTMLKTMAKWLKSKSLELAGADLESKKSDEVTSPLYDLGKLESISRGDYTFIKKVLGIFVDQTPSAIQEIKLTGSTGDYETMGKIAHRIKPSLDNLGIKTMFQVIRDIEKYEETGGEKSELRDKIILLEETVMKVIEELKANVLND